MGSLTTIGTVMLLVIALIAVGVFCRKRGLTNDAFDAGLSKIVLSISLPAMILDSVLSNTDLPDSSTVLTLLGVSTLFFVVLSVVSFLLVKVLFSKSTKAAQGVYAFTIAFGNTGFIGFPIVGAIFGPDAILYGAIYNIPYNVFMFSVGEIMITMASTEENSQSIADQAKTMAKSLISPTNIACLAAIILVLLRVTDDGFVGQLCSTLGQMVAPAALLIVGSTLGKMKVKQMLTDVGSYVATAFRLLIVPLAFLAASSFVISDPLILGTIAILAGTPVATVGTILCITHDGDIQTMSKCTFLTTVLSLVTIPILALIVL